MHPVPQVELEPVAHAPFAIEDGAESDASAEIKLQRAAEAFTQYRRTPLAERSRRLCVVAEILETQSDRWAKLMTVEMSKTLLSARAEVGKCAALCRYYAEHGAAMLADETLPTPEQHSVLRYQPLGPLLAIMPWNFLFWQVIRFAAPALFAGNTILLKHAPNVPGCSRAIEHIFAQAGFEPGVLQSLFSEPEQIARLIADDRVRGVTLTGSEAAGASVAAGAGRAIKKVVLELGGSDACVIMPSGHLEQAIEAAVQSRMLNNGQSCIAAKRILVHTSIFDLALESLLGKIAALRVGDPLDEQVKIGPLAMERFALTLERQVDEAVEAGARVRCGGRRHPLGPAFFEPTLLIDLPRKEAVGREEFFGPVMLVYRVADRHDALVLSNDSPFGLAASVWTNDPDEQQWFAEHLDVGQVTINAMTVSDPRVPFGGTKRSGLGRELGTYGVREFTNVKSIKFGRTPESP